LADLEPDTLAPPSKDPDPPNEPTNKDPDPPDEPPSKDPDPNHGPPLFVNTTVEEPLVALDAIIPSSNTEVLVPEPLFAESPAPRPFVIETPKTMDTALVAATLNNIDSFTKQDVEKRPMDLSAKF
jgi:hypothetical protein